MGAALVAPALLTTGCIEEVLPTNSVVQEQLDGNAKAISALVWAMPGHLNQVGTSVPPSTTTGATVLSCTPATS